MHTGPSAAKDAGGNISFRTTCWRVIRVGLLALSYTQRPVRRVSLEIGPSSETEAGTWAGLTAGEARQLAAALLTQAAAAEHHEGLTRQPDPAELHQGPPSRDA
jgi:hypothetical protein